MNTYITSTTIKTLREQKGLTQGQLAAMLCLSDKTISKWETGKGLPDISLLEPLARALGVSLPELLAGRQVINTNRGANLMKGKWYICPICGNVLHANGEAVISCCGVTVPPREADAPDAGHDVTVELIEHEYYVSLSHTMTKDHYISYIAYTTGDRVEMVKLYPEGPAEARFFSRGHGTLYWYCNRDGLFSKRI